MSDQDYPKTGQASLSSHPDSNLDVDERQMRAGLLSLGGSARPTQRVQSATAPKARHRFVQDGEVPVIHLTGQRDGDAVATFRGRIATLEAALEAEQNARAKADQAAHAALTQLHAMETKLAHVELASREAIAAERLARAEAEAALREAVAAREEPPAPIALPPAPKKERVKRVNVARTPRVKEPKPVKWWLAKAR